MPTSVKELEAVTLHWSVVAVYFKAVLCNLGKEVQTNHTYSQKSTKV